MADTGQPAFTVDGAREWARRFFDAGGQLQGRHLGQLMDKIEAGVCETVDQNFRMEGRPRPWRKHSQVTLARRTKGKGTGGGMFGFMSTPMVLQSTGALRMSVTRTRREARARGAIRLTRGRLLLVGSSLVYAAAHQYGLPARKGQVHPHTRKAHTRVSRSGRVHQVAAHYVRDYTITLPPVPKRPFLVVPRRDRDYLELIAADHVWTVFRLTQGGVH